AMADRITVATTLEETAEAVKNGVAVVHWCGSQECAEKIETAVDASILGSDIRSDQITVSDGPCVACGGRGTSTLVARTY
ncbi:proline--tRNA ligase, partial [Methanoculleus bourgensis]